MTGANSNAYLTFRIHNILLAIHVSQVIEVLHKQELFPLPSKINLVLGMLHFRDEYIPVIDSFTKFAVDKNDNVPAFDKEKTHFIILEIENGQKTIKIALTANKVLGVQTVSEQEIKPPPSFTNNMKIQYLTGIFNSLHGSHIVLNADYVFSNDEIVVLQDIKIEHVN